MGPVRLIVTPVHGPSANEQEANVFLFNSVMWICPLLHIFGIGIFEFDVNIKLIKLTSLPLMKTCMTSLHSDVSTAVFLPVDRAVRTAGTI